MQYLILNKSDTLSDISKIIGQKNIDALLNENNLARTPKLGKAWAEKANSIIAESTEDVTGARKAALLNNLVDNTEVFEKACAMDETEWKLFSATQAFKDAIKVPESVKLPFSSRIIGGIGNGAILGGARSISSSDPVSPITYNAVMEELKTSSVISPAIFNEVNTSPGVKLDNTVNIETKTPIFAFNIPWGKIQMYSVVLQETMDFPVYPETLNQGRKATYTSMPDVIYQYEPWIVYDSSGPREQSLSFHMHRDLWSGNHLDGRANDLIRFCEANTFPDYNGSAVTAPFIRLYIDGSLFISGVITSTEVEWSGPLGLDNWYLEFNLSLSIQEISETALNIRTVRNFGLIGS